MNVCAFLHCSVQSLQSAYTHSAVDIWYVCYIRCLLSHVATEHGCVFVILILFGFGRAGRDFHVMRRMCYYILDDDKMYVVGVASKKNSYVLIFELVCSINQQYMNNTEAIFLECHASFKKYVKVCNVYHLLKLKILSILFYVLQYNIAYRFAKFDTRYT